MGAYTIHVGAAGVNPVAFQNGAPLAIIAGTCALEGREITLRTAEHLVKLSQKLGFGLVYKGSFDKANRTSATGGRGVGLEAGLALLAEVRATFGVPVLTDIHETHQAAPVAAVVDCLQIPAFLARQTDLLWAAGQAAAARPGVAVNIKKGQFMAPPDMVPAAAKVAAASPSWPGGVAPVLLTERGTTFGYGDLVVDMRSLPGLAATGYPTVFDITHSTMRPSGLGDKSGGQRQFAAPLARAAVAVGVAGLFLETHPDPARATSDTETQLPLADLKAFLTPLLALDRVVKKG